MPVCPYALRIAPPPPPHTHCSCLPDAAWCLQTDVVSDVGVQADGAIIVVDVVEGISAQTHVVYSRLRLDALDLSLVSTFSSRLNASSLHTLRAMCFLAPAWMGFDGINLGSMSTFAHVVRSSMRPLLTWA